MTKLGYETFRELQRSVFKELGSVDTTGNCICASCCVVRTAMAHGTLASPQPLKHGRQIHITEGPEGPHAY